MPRNPESSINNDEQSQEEEPSIVANQELLNEAERNRNLSLGSRVLALVNFEKSHKPIVESSFNKARKKGEKLPSKNSERRTYAYLSRLEKLIQEHGNDAEKRLWLASIKEDLLVDEENITEATWEAKKQEYRDNGYGNVDLTEKDKHEYAEEWRRLQLESLRKWVDYLGDENSPYPLWFKIYAWNGMTKMGVFNKSKGQYETRNETTVAPYPEPDAEVLGKVFETVSHFYGNGDSQLYTEDGERNIDLEKLIQSGNFAKIYNAIEREISPIIEPPEKAEDVNGEWVEYKPGEEDFIAIAAKGTGWCVASSSVGKNYLENGRYGAEKTQSDIPQSELKSRFFLFHLKDPVTGKLSKNAVASIRLNLDGEVAEISGLGSGQSLNDSLVQSVEEKVKSLPGGEAFLPKFRDKNELIRLDRKMKNGEELTREELEFIYELNRPINTLDTYNSRDPRIDELRKTYNLKYALDAGIDPITLASRITNNTLIQNLETFIAYGTKIDDIVPYLGAYTIVQNIDTLIDHGANINAIVSHLDAYSTVQELDKLIANGANINIDDLVPALIEQHSLDKNSITTVIEHGANIDKLVSQLNNYQIAHSLDVLMDHGANIDIDKLVSSFEPNYIIQNLDFFIAHGATIDVDSLITIRSQYSVTENLDTLIKHGANIDKIVSHLDTPFIVNNLDKLNSYNANINLDKILDEYIEQYEDINQLIPNLDSSTIVQNLEALLNRGANIENIVSHMTTSKLVTYMGTLLDHGANIDNIVSHISDSGLNDNLETIITHGANANNLIPRLNKTTIFRNLDILNEHGAKIDVNTIIESFIDNGASIDQIISRLYYYKTEIIRDLDVLLAHGATMETLLPYFDADTIVENLDALINHGANININELITKIHQNTIVNNIDTLLTHGANINTIISSLEPIRIIRNLDILTEHGATIDIDELVSQLDSDYILRTLSTLISHGADKNNLISRLSKNDIVQNLNRLTEEGIDINNIVSQLDTPTILNEAYRLIGCGADINMIVNRLLPEHRQSPIVQKLISRLNPTEIINNKNILKENGYNPRKLRRQKRREIRREERNNP